MFQFTRFAPITGYRAFSTVGCPIRKSPDQWLFAPPRSLSQLITSFVASKSQGIPHTLLFTFFKVFSKNLISYIFTFLSKLYSIMSKNILGVGLGVGVSVYSYLYLFSWPNLILLYQSCENKLFDQFFFPIARNVFL
jgi:hypothetical protein